MAITFTWSVTDMNKITATGAVDTIDWSCSGVDADTGMVFVRTGAYIHTSLVDVPTAIIGQDSDGNDIFKTTPVKKQSAPDHTASGFKPYADLTEADVLVWCKADGVEARTEAKITKGITAKIKVVPHSTGMPWAAE